MINTYQTSMAPPPLPPRLNRSQPVLIPAPLPLQRSSKPLVQFLAALVLLNLMMSVGGFIYLYHNLNKEPHFSDEGKAALYSSEKQETWYKILAHVVAKPPSPEDPKSKYLQWDIDRSLLKNINYYKNTWLTIPESGDYYVYSKVTFSKGHAEVALSSQVKLRKNNRMNQKEKLVMQAYCDLDSSSMIPRQCTATQGEVITLDKGNQLSVWVPDPSLVDYEEGSTTFGMYKI